MSVRRSKAWGIAAAMGLAAALVAATVTFFLTRTESASRVNPGDRLSAAIDTLEQDSFYVAPELRDRLGADQVAAIRRAVESSDRPFYLAYMTNTTDAGYYQNYNAVDIIADHIGEDGLYAIVDGRQSVDKTSRGVQFPYIDGDALRGRDHVALERYARTVAAAPKEPADAFDNWGGTGGGFAAGAMFAVGGYLVLLVITWMAGLFRKPA